MKRFLAAAASAGALLISGCAENTPPAEEVREQFRRGFSGEGQLGPIDRSDDPYVNPRGTDPIPH